MTKCRNRSRVALSSIFHPLESPEMQSSQSVAVKGDQVLSLVSQTNHNNFSHCAWVEGETGQSTSLQES